MEGRFHDELAFKFMAPRENGKEGGKHDEKEGSGKEGKQLG